MRSGSHDAGRYGVVRNHDARVAWFEVIDKQAGRPGATVYATRSRNAAHAHADHLNRGPA
jgi:hypothetical protein